MKSKIISFSTLLLSIGALCACSGGGSTSTPSGSTSQASSQTSGSKTQITFLGWGSAAELDIFGKMIAQFENDFPQYTVNYKQASADNYIEVLGNLKNNRKNMPDVFYMPDTSFVQWATMKDSVMLDLSSYIEKSSSINLNNIWEEGINAYRYDPENKKFGTGGIYGLPKDLGPNALTYNKTYVTKPVAEGGPGLTIISKKADQCTAEEKYGYNPETRVLNDQIPMTWAQFVRFAQDTTKGDIQTQTDAIVGITHYPLESAYICNGGSFTDDASHKTAQIANDGFAESLQFVADLSNKWNCMTTAEGQTSQSGETRFRSNLAASSFIGAWEMPNLWQCNFDWDVLYTPVPNSSGHYDPVSYPEAWKETYKEGCTSKSYLGSVAFSVYKNSSVIDGAYKLAEYLSVSPTAQRINYKLGQAVPNLIDMAKGEFLTEQLSDTKGMNRPNNRIVYVDMMSSSPRRPQAYTYNDEWWAQMWECTDDTQYALARVWNLKPTQTYGTHVDVYDWSTNSRISNWFLDGLQEKCQARLDLYKNRYNW